MHGEISYDLIMQDDMGFVEGTYRLPGQDWQVVIVSRFEIETPEVQHGHWDSGVTGVFIRFPRKGRLNTHAVEKILSETFGVTEWTVVRGPDSMVLR